MADILSRSRGRGIVRSPQNLVSGLLLIAFAAAVVWLLGGLSQGTLRSIGPAAVPRWTAYGIGAGGLALALAGFIRDGHPLERWHLRGPVLVVLALVVFAALIRSPGFLVAGPAAMLIGGFASREARPLELVVFAVAMTAFCALLFKVALGQPLPMLVVERFAINW